MERNPVGWFEIYVQDMEGAKGFCETVFDIRLTRLEAPDPSIEMWTLPMFENAPGCPGPWPGWRASPRAARAS